MSLYFTASSLFHLFLVIHGEEMYTRVFKKDLSLPFLLGYSIIIFGIDIYFHFADTPEIYYLLLTLPF